MSAQARRLWTVAAVHAVAALGLLLFAHVSIRPRVPSGFGLAIGVVAAAGLFTTLARSHPTIRGARRRAPTVIVRGAFFAVRSASEEVLWRWFVLGSLAPVFGAGGALVVSTAGFAAAHMPAQGRRGAAVHLVTGTVFGTVFLSTGSLLAAISAHASYNLLVVLAVESSASGAPRPALTSAGRDPPEVASLRAVSKRFGMTPALRGVSLELREGEVVALLGANGAGKTTAISILTGLRRPDSGTARLFGRDPRAPASRRALGITPQELGFPPTLTVDEIVRFVRGHYARPREVNETLERFRLGDLRRRQAGGLSGGQRRRLSVALAFVGNPSLAVLDEPTTGLDVESRRAVWAAIAEFAAAGCRTVLLTTHNLEEADALARRIVVLSEGSVLADATSNEIKAHVGLRRIRIRPQRLPTLPGVMRASEQDGRLVLYVDDTGVVVRELVRAGADLEELEVLPVSLEEAYIALTGAAG